MSLLTTTTTIKTIQPLPTPTTLPSVLTLLHSPTHMLTLNPLLKTSTPLPAARHAAFLAALPAGATLRNPSTPLYLYEVVEGAEGGTGSWRGGWAKRFVPEEIVYETSYQGTERGMVSCTKAQMGVRSVTRWVVREGEEGGGEGNGEGKEKGLVLEITGEVSSNRMLMTFIRTTIEGSYAKLGRDFVEMLEREQREKA